MQLNQSLRIGMIGGGEGSFIGGIHRMAARLDGLFELTAGALSSDKERSRSSGVKLGLASERIYTTYEEMLTTEKKRSDGIHVVSIVTPNHLHFAPAKMALDLGFDVVIDKPLSFDLAQARELRALVQGTGRQLALTYTYSAYPAVMEARALVAAGKIGRLRKVVVQYPQGWLSEKIESSDSKQAAWRTDPTRSGASCCFGDIGSHAVHLAETISGQQVTELLADFQTFVPGRSLDDDATVLLRFNEGLKGVAIVSQISNGENNSLQISLYGEKGGLHWSHGQPNILQVLWPHRPDETLHMGAGNNYLHPETLANLRTPAGHPEGYLEAFANIYKNFALTILANKNNTALPLYQFPNVDDGFRGMALVDAAVQSSKKGSVWTSVEKS